MQNLRQPSKLPEGYLLNSLLTASDREDLLTLLVHGFDTDGLVIPDCWPDEATQRPPSSDCLQRILRKMMWQERAKRLFFYWN